MGPFKRTVSPTGIEPALTDRKSVFLPLEDRDVSVFLMEQITIRELPIDHFEFSKIPPYESEYIFNLFSWYEWDSNSCFKIFSPDAIGKCHHSATAPFRIHTSVSDYILNLVSVVSGRIELPTLGSSGRRSTAELRHHYGRHDWDRTSIFTYQLPVAILSGSKVTCRYSKILILFFFRWSNEWCH